MRLFAGKIQPLSVDIVRALLDAKAIEAPSRKEVEADLESVLRSYVDQERIANERAKDVMAKRGGGQDDFGRLRKLAAEELGIQVGDDMLDFLLNQLIEMLMHSNNVDEVYMADHDLRRTMRPALKKHLEMDAVVDAEVRSQLKHVSEGTRTWEVEYRRLMDDIQRRKGL